MSTNEPRPGVIVTGATSPLGQALARNFARAGYFVGVHYFSKEQQAAELLGEIEADGGCGMLLGADLTDAERSAALVKEFLGAHGDLDVLVNNAGRSGTKIFLLTEPKDWQEMLTANLVTPYAITRAALRAMIARKQGAVINISSMSGLLGMAGQVHYSTAKSGLHGFTKALAREVGRYNIRINAIASGAFESTALDEIPEDKRQWLASAACLQRLGQADEIASVATFLASPAASFVTGQIIAVDGGIV